MLFGIGLDPSEGNVSEFPVNLAFPEANNDKIFKILIPADAKEEFLKHLKKIGFDESRIYPEFEHISGYVTNDLLKK
jgi:hypothetical protein